MLLLLIVRAALAGTGAPASGSGPLPSVIAWRSPDGAFSLEIEPPVAWTSAEVSVTGGGATDVGAAAPGAPVLVKGRTTETGRLGLTVCAALADKKSGVCWSFDVTPTSIPVAPPALERAAPEKKKRRS